jgi:hypothetical protein
MCPSAISTPVFQAKISNIQNAADTSFVYSGGAYTFKNAAGTTTFSVSDAGAVVMGSAAKANHVLNGSLFCETAGASDNNTYRFIGSTNGGMMIRPAGGTDLYLMSGGYFNGTAYVAKSANTAIASFKANAPTADGDVAFEFYKQTDSSASDYTFSAGATLATSTVLGNCTGAGAWTFPVSVSVTGTADVSGTSAALRTDGGCYVAKIMSAGTVTDRTPFPEDLQTAIDAVNSMEKLPEGEYDSENKEKQLDHSKLHPYLRSGDHRDLSATVSCLVVYCRELSAKLDEANAKIAALESK